MLCHWDCKKTKWQMDLPEREECIKKVFLGSIKRTTVSSTIQPTCNIKHLKSVKVSEAFDVFISETLSKNLLLFLVR